MSYSTQRDELIEQCLRRVKNYRTQRNLAWSEQYQVDLAECIASVIHSTLLRKPHRIQYEQPSVPSACVPASYVDDVIQYYLVESPRVDRLRRSNDPLWKSLTEVIEGYARRWLASHYVPDCVQVSFDSLVLEIVNQTFVKLADSRFEGYCYDCPLDRWMVKYAYHIAQELLGDSLQYQQRNQSLEAVLPGTDEFEVGETISDPTAQSRQDQMLAWLVIERAWPALSPDQAEVITRKLAHQSIQEIARAMNRTPKAIYSLEERAVRGMRRYLKLNGEF